MSFERENRYIVIKRKDIRFNSMLPANEKTADEKLLEFMAERSRKEARKPPLECVVIESDWPEYELVWKMIQERMEGKVPARTEPQGHVPKPAPWPAPWPAPPENLSLSRGVFQYRVDTWMLECFGAEIASDTVERNHRFLEEALELVQACGCSHSEAHQLVDYVFNRPVGEKHQEVGGTMVTLAALCTANDLNMMDDGFTELRRILNPEIMEKIRAKQAAKPRYSPLPEHPVQTAILDMMKDHKGE